MKALRILGRSIKDSFKGVFRNFSLSLASISCITITLILVGFSIILSYNVKNFTTTIEKDMTIVVFVDRKATNEEVDTVSYNLNKLSNIDSIEFVSKEETRKNMQKESPIFDSIMSQYNEYSNPLQDSFLIKVTDIEKIGVTAQEIKQIEKVEIVKYGEGSVEELVKIFNIVQKISLITVLALVLVTAFLISNTIKITIQSRGKEIEIMRLVGASNLYIRQPFFFEGIILGLLGSLIPISVIIFGYSFLYKKLGGQLFTAIIKLVHPNNLVFNTCLMILVVAVVVGAFGSFRAVRKYLKI